MSNLQEWGFNHFNENTRLGKLSKQEAFRELDRNIDFFTQHALVDQPVSSPYYYWFDMNHNLYSYSSLRPEYLVDSQIDKKERGGAMLEGFQALSQTLSTPNRIVLHYSPKGKASFRENVSEKFDVDSYKDGQLTLQYFDEEKVHAVGVMVSNEDLIFSIFDHFGLPRNKLAANNEEKRITNYLLHPLLTQFSLDEFLRELDFLGHNNEILYKDKNDHEYTLGKTLELIHKSFLGKLPQTHRKYFDQTMKALEKDMIYEAWTKEKVQEAYLKVILNFATYHGLSEVKLMASCGGSIKSTKDIIDLLYNNDLSEHLTTDFLNPSNIVSLYLSELRAKEPFICPKCGFETVESVGNKCPSCKITKEQAVEQGYVTC